MAELFTSIAELNDGWKWMLLAMILAIAEVMVPGVFLIWLSAGALIVGAITMLFDVPVSGQFALAAILAFVAVMLGRRWYRRSYPQSEDPLLNNRSARLIGVTVEITETVSGNDGRAKVGDSAWPVRGERLVAGNFAKVVAVEDGVLVVESDQK